jgi:hypothetical protein
MKWGSFDTRADLNTRLAARDARGLKLLSGAPTHSGAPNWLTLQSLLGGVVAACAFNLSLCAFTPVHLYVATSMFQTSSWQTPCQMDV